MPHCAPESAAARLQQAGYKLTRQRKAVLALFGPGTGHLSAGDVHEALRAQNPDISLVTVYRTLEVLADADILRCVNFNDGMARYEWNLGRGDHHHHLICTGCGAVVEFGDCQIRPIEQKLEQTTGFRIDRHWLEVMGLCAKCRGASSPDGAHGDDPSA
ncbi:MAG: Fur family transcriptional regulator [Clostridia bacterium]|nr:Fur family transcriptional regulator [Clostridia bacterium]